MESALQMESGDPFEVVISKQLELSTVRLQCLQKLCDEVELQRSIGSLSEQTHRLEMEACKEQADVLDSMKKTGYQRTFFAAPLLPAPGPAKRAKVCCTQERAVRQSLAAVEKALDLEKEELKLAGERLEALVSKKRKTEQMLTKAEKNISAVREMAHSFNRTSVKAKSVAQLLPVEILQDIFGMLPRSDFVTAGQVCQSWRAFAKDPRQWRTVKLTERVRHRKDISRELKFAPYIDVLEIFELRSSSVDFSDIHSKVRVLKLLQPSTRGFLKSFGGSFDELEVLVSSRTIYNLVEPLSVQKMVLDFKYFVMPAVKSRLVQKSTLTSLKCRNIQCRGLEFFLRRHAETLQLLSVRLLNNALDDINSLLLTCTRLKTVTMECCSSLRLPPNCETVTLIISCQSYYAGPCNGCKAVLASKNISTIRLVTRNYIHVSARMDLLKHLKLFEGFISSSHTVLVTCLGLKTPELHQNVLNYLENESPVGFTYDPSWHDVLGWDSI